MQRERRARRGPGGGPPQVEPADPDRARAVREIAGRHRPRRGPLLPILHEVLDRFGHIDDDDIPVIADVLNLSRAEVHGVVSFYHDFRRTPPPPSTVRICRGEACQAVGGEALYAAVTDRFASRTDVEVSDIFCLGNCALGPSATIDGTLRAQVSAGDQVWSRLPERPYGSRQSSSSAAETVPTKKGRKRRRRTVWVPRDCAAVAVGADEVADAFAAIDGITVRRNGSRGMLWLEPLVEVETEHGRVGYANVAPAEVAAIVAEGLTGGEVDGVDRIGLVEEFPWLARQRRVGFARVGVIEPTDIDAYRKAGGYAGLARALSLDPAAVVAEITAAGLRGRGGAGFPAGIKWETVRTAHADQKFVCCNADEGDSGTFADRILLEGDPFTLIEGMTIAAYAVGATEGFVYVRSEYPAAIATLRRAIDVAYAHGLLGPDISGHGVRFDLEVRVGAGAYICGEETSMLESLEGRRGEVRAKPPIPALHGLFGRPTLVNNVLTLGSVPMVLADGGEAYAAVGVGRSRGTQVFQLAGDIARGGIVEADFGITVRELIEDFGGGTRSGRPVKAAQIGGPLGAYIVPAQFDLPMDYEAFAEAGAMLGHGGIVVFDDTMDASAMARFAMEFCARESCGKCTPCRIGSVRGVEVIDRIRADADRQGNLALLQDLCSTMTRGSLCAMGGLTPMPVQSALRHFPEDFTGGPP
ncbi:MAG: NAD(P)H-dependent oxidoreductase subunit E [Tetrasphaera sp.]|nr:NAD(P)H-dependent oxidoreductase subunit E [Tetrasphaera sp.]